MLSLCKDNFGVFHWPILCDQSSGELFLKHVAVIFFPFGPYSCLCRPFCSLVKQEFLALPLMGTPTNTSRVRAVNRPLNTPSFKNRTLVPSIVPSVPTQYLCEKWFFLCLYFVCFLRTDNVKSFVDLVGCQVVLICGFGHFNVVDKDKHLPKFWSLSMGENE